MILSDLPAPAEASVRESGPCQGFAQAGNRCPSPIGVEDMLFGIMRYPARNSPTRRALQASAFTPITTVTSTIPNPIASGRAPFEVSSAIAVVMVPGNHGVFPPPTNRL